MIEAALDLLGDAGYGGTSIDAISRRSGVARTTIYRHWRSLAEIVHEAAMTTVGVKAVPDTGDARADLRAHLGELAAKLNSGWQGLLEQILREGTETGEFVCADPRASAWRLLALLDGLTIQVVAQTDGPGREDVERWSHHMARVETGRA